MSEEEQESAFKKVKLNEEVAVKPPIHCQFFVKRKKRFCKMTLGKNFNSSRKCFS